MPTPNERFVTAAKVSSSTPLSTDDLTAKQAADDFSLYVFQVVNKWSEQQSSDRSMRTWCAIVLGVIFLLQVAAINTAFFMTGRKMLCVDEWTARVFITAVFSELAAMVFFIVKYLFRSTGDEVIREVGKMALEHTPKPHQ